MRQSCLLPERIAWPTANVIHRGSERIITANVLRLFDADCLGIEK
jgi:hypothetical protein